jgi:hypothetical protein
MEISMHHANDAFSAPAASPATGARRAFTAVRWAVIAALATLAACGGGGSSDSGTGTGTTTVAAYTSGAITGFGSIIVNGVRFDDTTASVLDEDGHHVTTASLALGATVEIESAAVDHSTAKAKATKIRLGGEMVGPVSAIDTTASQFTLLGQTVEVNSTTVYDSSLSGGLSAITTGAVLAVHAQLDATRAVYVATRVEARSAATEYRLSGTVSALNTTTQQFQLGGALISYASLSPQPTGLADGLSVRVKLQLAQVSGAWVATELKGAGLSLPDSATEAEVHGRISAWTSATQFSVNGVTVDASSATFPQGQTGVVLGARVEVAGTVVSGVLVATTVKVETETESTHDHATAHELHGTLSALDTTAKTFVLRGLTVSYASVTTWDGLTEASLANGLRVEVKGGLAADGTTVTASVISLDH